MTGLVESLIMFWNGWQSGGNLVGAAAGGGEGGEVCVENMERCRSGECEEERVERVEKVGRSMGRMWRVCRSGAGDERGKEENKWQFKHLRIKSLTFWGHNTT